MTVTSGRRRRWRSGLALSACVLGVASLASGQGAPASSASAVGSAEPPVADPRTTSIRALMDGTLAPTVDPDGLFDVPLGDEEAIQIERRRVGALLETMPVSSALAPATSASAPRANRATRPAPIASASASAASSASAPLVPIDPARWQARLDLDRARLDFYALPRERREDLLRAHAARREAARPRETDDERRAREADTERRRVLEAAQRARSEAERLVGEEMARLLGIEGKVATVRGRLHEQGMELSSRRDTLLGWQRRVRDATTAASTDADATYDALRRALSGTRDELDAALDALDATSSDVPAIGPDPLVDIPPDVPTESVRERRAIVEQLLREARAEEMSLREERSSALLDESTTLNRERLELLSHLSAAKRDAITGFTAVGLDQARAEARQLGLILRYHRHIALRSIGLVRQREGLFDASPWRVLAMVIPWALAALVFAWWRPRSAKLLALIEERMIEDDRQERLESPSLGRRAARFARQTHRPLEWLLFFGVTVWLLPATARQLLEVQLLTVIVGWTLGVALLVTILHALSTTTDHAGRSVDEAASLRLRSLRLVGRVIVAFALVLTLSARLVGQGTVHSWVMSTCWLAAIPVFLVLVRWWRETVFERVERVRRPSALEAWVLANRRGWKSFFAAMLGAIHLFVMGTWRTVRHWLGGFDVTRRAHAYLFKRELDRLASERPAHEAIPLRPEAVESLAPDRPGATWVNSPADETLEAIQRQVAGGRGGVVAVVGGRGIGKSSLQRRLASLVPGAVQVSCHDDTSAAALTAALGLPASDAGVVGARPPLVMLDDIDELVKPVFGGLRSFDEILSLARAHSQGTLWVFAIDGIVWPFLRRARDARPLFDEVRSLAPWTDDQIGALLTARSAEAGVVPTFEDLLDPLPATADEIDRLEALAAKQLGYVRLIWDYSRGNPAMALEVWRSSLVEDSSGATRVQPLQAPDADRLNVLSDATVFVLRAVLQLAPATVAEVAQVTRMSEAQVHNAFRFGQAHGYLVEEQGKVRVSWAWLRAVMVLLERRHMVVNA